MTKEFIIKYINYGGIWITILMVAVSCLSVFNDQVGLHEHSYGNYMVAFLFYGLVGTAVLVRLSQYIRIPYNILDTFMQGALFFICMHTLMFEYMLLMWNKLTGDFFRKYVDREDYSNYFYFCNFVFCYSIYVKIYSNTFR